MRILSSALVGLGLIFAASCAQTPVKYKNSFDTRQEEKYLAMEERVARQETQIQRLVVAVEAMRSGKIAAKLVTKNKVKREAPTPKVPTRKLSPESDGDWEDEISEGESAREESAPSDTVVDSSHEGMQRYFEGLQLMEQLKYDKAASTFQKFVSENPGHVYADRAEYWIMEAHFRGKEHSLAVVAANRFESKYPYSFRLPDVLLKRALSHAGMGQTDTARASLRALVRKFPANPIADTASRKLTELALKRKPPLMPAMPSVN